MFDLNIIIGGGIVYCLPKNSFCLVIHLIWVYLGKEPTSDRVKFFFFFELQLTLNNNSLGALVEAP
jgi:hypothetical protein